MSALAKVSFEEAKKQSDFWGRLLESSVGAALATGIEAFSKEFAVKKRSSWLDLMESLWKNFFVFRSKNGASVQGRIEDCKLSRVQISFMDGQQEVKWT